jgi:hypothetical protein
VQDQKLSERNADDENHHANVGNARARVPFAFKARDGVVASEVPRALNVCTLEEAKDASADPNVHSVEQQRGQLEKCRFGRLFRKFGALFVFLMVGLSDATRCKQVSNSKQAKNDWNQGHL